MSAFNPEIQVLGPLEIFFNIALLGAGLAVLYLFGYVSAIKALDDNFMVKRGLKKLWKKSKIQNIEV